MIKLRCLLGHDWRTHLLTEEESGDRDKMIAYFNIKGRRVKCTRCGKVKWYMRPS